METPSQSNTENNLDRIPTEEEVSFTVKYPELYPYFNLPSKGEEDTQGNAPSAGSMYFHDKTTDEKEIQIVEFELDETVARDRFTNWIQGLWFAPTGFKKQATIPPFRKAFLPFYIFDTTAHSSYKCQYEEADQNDKTITTWKDIGGTRIERYQNKISLCDSNYREDDNASQLISSVMVNESSLNHPKWPKNANASKKIVPNILASSLIDVHVTTDVNVVWKQVESQLSTLEREKCEKDLRKATKSSNLRELTVDVGFTDIQSRCIYLPAFIATYVYDKKDHLFIINGITGQADGQRPSYGLGRLGDFKKGIINFVGTVTNKNQQSGIYFVTGEKLTETDETYNIYDNNHIYLLFPRSDSYLLTASVGYVTLRNRSNAFDVELISQKRRGAQRGITFVLKAGSIQTFDYRGHWCIEVISGNPDDIEVIDHQTWGGNGNNLLGMA